MFCFPFGFKHKVDPDKFVALWPVYFEASRNAVELEEGQKPSKLWDIPEIQAISACRSQMLELGITSSEAASYGSRLSLAKTLTIEPDLMERFGKWMSTTDNGVILNQILLKAVAVTKIKKYGIFGIMLDFDNLEFNLQKE